MPVTLGYVDREPSGRALEVLLDREWRRHQARARALDAAKHREAQHRLETDPRCAALYVAMGHSIGEVTTEAGWVGLHEQVTGLVEARELSVRHGQELEARLLRVARARGWLRAWR